MVVLSGAPHPIAANLWINFNLDAADQRRELELHRLPRARTRRPRQFIDPAILANPNLNPAAAVFDKLTELIQLEGADLDKYTQRWNALERSSRGRRPVRRTARVGAGRRRRPWLARPSRRADLRPARRRLAGASSSCVPLVIILIVSLGTNDADRATSTCHDPNLAQLLPGDPARSTCRHSSTRSATRC